MINNVIETEKSEWNRVQCSLRIRNEVKCESDEAENVILIIGR